MGKLSPAGMRELRELQRKSLKLPSITQAQHDLLSLDYENVPVPVEQFVRDPYYFGSSVSELHDTLVDDLSIVFAPDSRINEWILKGSIGYGKCVREGTLIPTGDGYLPVEQVFALQPEQVAAESGVCPLKTVHDEHEVETCCLVTKHGHELEGRPGHRIRVLDYNTFGMRWVALEDLEPGMCVLEKQSTVFGKQFITSAQAELAGWYAAKGSWNGHCYCLDLHPEELPYVERLAERAGVTKCQRSKTVPRLYLKGLPDRLVPYFSCGPESRKKCLPAALLASTRKTICMYLRGLFSGDGYARDGSEFTTCSRLLAQQVRVLMTYLGYYVTCYTSKASYKKNGARTYTGDKYTVRVIGPDSAKKFVREIGFACFVKQKVAVERSKKYSSNSDHSFGFKLPRESAKALRDLQPKYGSLGKTDSPSGKLHRVVYGQAITRRLLQEVKKAGGVLPHTLAAIESGDLLFDTVKEVRRGKAHCYDLTVDGDPSYLSDGFISHNTTVGTVGLGYSIYKLTCLRDPAKFYGLLPGSRIVFGIFNITLTRSDQAYENLRLWMQNSPYFQEHAPLTVKPADPIEIANKRIQVVQGSMSEHALGENMFGFMLDEANFFKRIAGQRMSQADRTKAHQIYTACKRRQVSRFMRFGIVPGVNMLMSSEQTQTSFLESRVARSKADKSIFITSKALWETKPKENYSGVKFQVVVADGLNPSAILEEDEVVPDGRKVIDIPIELKPAFEEDCDEAVRDIAGQPVTATGKFFGMPERILQCVNRNRVHPFGRMSLHDISTENPGVRILDYLHADKLFKITHSVSTLRVDHGTPRAAHIDIGVTGDSLGLAIGHLRPEIGTLYYDLLLQIIPPERGENDIEAVVEFLKDLKMRGMRFISVTYDQFQSRQSIQQLKKAGFPAGKLSIGYNEYSILRRRVYSGPLACDYYQYAPLIKELTELEKGPGPGDPPDHPSDGGKDVADAACGVAAVLTAISTIRPGAKRQSRWRSSAL